LFVLIYLKVFLDAATVTALSSAVCTFKREYMNTYIRKYI